MKEIQCLLIREDSIKHGLGPVLLRDKETSRAIPNLHKGNFKMEPLNKHQGDIETFELLKIIDQVRLFNPFSCYSCCLLSFTELCTMDICRLDLRSIYLRILFAY